MFMVVIVEKRQTAQELNFAYQKVNDVNPNDKLLAVFVGQAVRGLRHRADRPSIIIDTTDHAKYNDLMHGWYKAIMEPMIACAKIQEDRKKKCGN